MIVIAGWLAALSGWQRLAVAIILGAGAAVTLPPFHLFPLLVVAFTGLVWLLDGARSGAMRFVVGWAFGLGYFVTGLYWTGLSMLVDAERFAVFIPLAVLGLPAGLAIFTGLATLAAGWLSPRGHGRIAALAAAWGLAEYLRGTLFTGFPWNLIGHAWAASDVTLQAAAFTGVYALGVITVWVAAVPAALVSATVPAGAGPTPAQHVKPHLAIAVTAALTLIVAGAARLAAAPDAARMDRFDDVRLRIVQANIPQHLKWHPDYRDRNLEQYMQLSAEAGAGAVTHVVWPEAAVPFFMGTNPERWQRLASVAPENGLLLTGILRHSQSDGGPRQFWNSLVGIDRSAGVAFVYDKRHLVPFGEYLPLRGVLRALGIEQLAFGPSEYSPGRSGTAPMAATGLPPFRALICYEVIFPGEIAGAERPAWLLNVTNDAWFGDSPGPYQHFAMARVRAVEQGVALVRAANTGISALVDPYGRVIASLGLGQRGVVDGTLPKPLTPPPYARWGDGVFWALVALLCIFSGFMRKIMKPTLGAPKKTDRSSR